MASMQALYATAVALKLKKKYITAILPLYKPFVNQFLIWIVVRTSVMKLIRFFTIIDTEKLMRYKC